MKEPKMQYLLLIYANESEYEKFGPSQKDTLLSEYAEFTRSVVQLGHLRAADRLRPVSTATSVRVRDGKTMITDGPFAETREQLGGYYLVEAKDLDEALEIAARIPSSRYGTIEVRPIWMREDY
jgi:hypothetical protein